MHDDLKKYFWDGSIDSFSPQFRLCRVIEYASFPDLLKYPFEEAKSVIDQIPIDRLRISENRKRINFMEGLDSI